MNDIIHIASLIRDSKQQILESMAGIAMQERAISDAYYYFKSRSGNGIYKEIPRKTSIVNRVKMLESIAFNKLDPKSLQYIRQQAAFSDKMKLNFTAFIKTLMTNNYMKPVFGLHIWFAAQSRLINSMIWICIIWLTLKFSMRRYKNIDFREYEPKWYIYWIITAILSMPVGIISSMHRYNTLLAGLWITWVVGLSGMVFVALIIVSISRNRASNDTGWINKTWLARARKTCSYAISGMAIIYIISLLAFIPHIRNAQKLMDFYVTHEAEIAADYTKSTNLSINDYTK